MAFAPAWVLDASSAMIAKRYIMGDMPLEAYTNRFSKSYWSGTATLREISCLSLWKV